MKKDLRTERRKLGDLGENVACSFLRNNNFEILDRNYLKKWGEIDIVAKKKGILRFIEVKTIRITSNSDVSRGTPVVKPSSLRGEAFRPEENVHPQKLKRLYRAIQTYLMEKNLDFDWQIDVVTVRLDMENRLARVEIIENIIL